MRSVLHPGGGYGVGAWWTVCGGGGGVRVVALVDCTGGGWGGRGGARTHN